MERIWLLTVLFCLSVLPHSYAQEVKPTLTQSVLKFEVKSEGDKAEPVSEALVKILTVDDSIITQGNTNEQGRVDLLIDMGLKVNIHVEKYDTVFMYNGIDIPQKTSGYEFPITLKIKMVTMEYISFSNIFLFYDQGEYALNDQMKAKINGLIREMHNKSQLTLTLNGYSDYSEEESAEYKGVSMRRVEALKVYLIESDIAENRLEIKDYKDTKPIRYVSGEEKVENPNRHVEIVVNGKEGK